MALGGRVAVLWHGALQQVDTPEAVYERPANLVVASCVGSPAANLLPATVAGGSLRLPMVDVPLDASARDRLGGRDRVVAAVRPEHLVDAALVPGDGASHGVAFAARVESADWTGSELVTRLRYRDDGPVPRRPRRGAGGAVDRRRGRGPGRPAGPGAGGPAPDRPVARVWLDRRRILLFDADTGAALGSAAPPLPDDDSSAE